MAAIDILGPIPAATNWCLNPSFETNSANWVGTNGTLAVDTTDAWVGVQCGKLTVTSVASDPRFETSSGARIPVLANDGLNIGGRMKAVSGRQIYISVEFLDAANATLLSTNNTPIVATGNWQYVTHSTLAPTNATQAVIKFRQLTSGSVIGDVLRLDGADVRKNQPLDSYIDGAQGALYHWSSTAHGSTSTRDSDVPVGLAGYGGQITVSTRVYRSNALGTEYEELSDYVLDGEIANDIDRDIKGSCSLQVSDVTKFTPFSWIKIYADRTREGIGTDTNIVGLFRIGLPESTYPSKTGTFNGLDVTVQLADTVTTGTYVVTAGTVVTTAIAALLDSAGFAGRYQIPASALTVPTEGKQWPRGTSYLVIINALLYDIGYYALYMNPDGTLASIPYQDRMSAEVAHTFTLGADAELLEQIDQTLSEDNLYNYVIATYTKPSGTVVTRTAENKNPAHPYSTVSLGALAGLPKVYRTLAIEANDVVDSTTLQALAREQLDRASMIRYVRMSILPHPDHRPHEIAELDFAGTGSEELSGRYFIESSSFGIGAGAGTMMMSGRKVETYD